MALAGVLGQVSLIGGVSLAGGCAAPVNGEPTTEVYNFVAGWLEATLNAEVGRVFVAVREEGRVRGWRESVRGGEGGLVISFRGGEGPREGQVRIRRVGPGQTELRISRRRQSFEDSAELLAAIERRLGIAPGGGASAAGDQPRTEG